jgi:hypothetical protein
LFVEAVMYKAKIAFENGDIIGVQLTYGKVAMIDRTDWPVVRDRNWRIDHPERDSYYAITDIGWHRGILGMHNLIMGTKNIDHRNGNRLDNRRCNLRLATSQQNMCNRGRQRNNKSGYKGVFPYQWDRTRYIARIGLNRCYHHLGVFTTAEAAARAYDKAARELHGEFARLNFPDEVVALTETATQGVLL